MKRFRNYDQLKAGLQTLLIRSVLQKPVVCSDRNGFRLIVLPDEHIYSFFLRGYLGYPEIGEQEYCKRTIRPGNIVFDVGANIGQFTLLFGLLVGDHGHVFAFEPCEETRRRLNIHTVLNGIHNVTIEPDAVYDTHGGYVSMNIFPKGYSVWNTIGHPKMFSRDDPKKRVFCDRRETVSTIRLDRYCRDRGIQHIDFLKVDVEGAELHALKGCAGLLKDHAIRRIQFEISNDMVRGMGLQGTEVFDYLSRFDYRCYPISQQGELLPETRRPNASFGNYLAMVQS